MNYSLFLLFSGAVRDNSDVATVESACPSGEVLLNEAREGETTTKGNIM